MHIRSDRRGAGSISVMFWLVLLGLTIHVGVKLIPMYMHFENMKDEMTIKAGVAQVLKDEEIVRDLVNKAKELRLPLGPDSFIVVRDEDQRRMKISTQWDVELSFLGGAYIRRFHFAPVVEESFMSINR